jgi:hypothetical protein
MCKIIRKKSDLLSLILSLRGISAGVRSDYQLVRGKVVARGPHLPYHLPSKVRVLPLMSKMWNRPPCMEYTKTGYFYGDCSVYIYRAWKLRYMDFTSGFSHLVVAARFPWIWIGIDFD